MHVSTLQTVGIGEQEVTCPQLDVLLAVLDMMQSLTRAGARKVILLVVLIALVTSQSGWLGPDAAYAAQARNAMLNADGRLANPSERLVAASPTLAITSVADNRGDYGGAVPAYAK